MGAIRTTGTASPGVGFDARVAATARQWNDALLVIALPSSPVAALACGWFFQGRVHRWWFTLSVAAMIVGLGGHALARRRPSPRNERIARCGFGIAVTLLGTMWGLLPFAIEGTRTSQESLLRCLLYPLGASGVNVVLNSASRLRFHLFQSTIFGLLVLFLLQMGGARNHLLAGTALGMCALNSVLHQRALSMSLASIRAQLTNADLLEAAQRDTERIEAANELLGYQATHDDLTGLLNRRGFADELERCVEHARAHGEDVCVMVGDLDRFKVINDSLGHEAGDTLLRVVAGRLVAAAPPGASFGRLGGDELVAVVPLGRSADADERNRVAAAIAETFRREVAAPVDLGAQRLVVTLSFGLSFGPQADESGGDLLRHADAALYQAKSSGRDRYDVFDETMKSAVARRVANEQRLRLAIAAGEIVPFYQPIVSARTGRAIGAEVLARWCTPSGKTYVAGQFIQLAEESGLVESMTEAVLAAAFDDLARWELGGLPPGFRLSVNLPPRFVSATSRTGRLTDLLGRAPLERITLEVTENAVVDDLGLAAARLNAYRVAGATVSLDDFGTGSASLTLLQRMPLDGVKLDRSFVTDIVSAEHDRLLVRGFVALATDLGLSVVAEGVETTDQAAALVGVGCDVHQGWLYGKAIPPAEFELLIGAPQLAPARNAIVA